MLSFPVPLELAKIVVLVLAVSSHEILMLPAGVANVPDKDIVKIPPAAMLSLNREESITVVPSHNLQTVLMAVLLFVNVTVPLANHVPVVP